MPVTVRNTDILFNDASTQSTAAVVNTTNVLNATAGASVGAVGTYAYLFTTYYTTSASIGSLAAGATVASTNLRYGNNTLGGSGTPSGTWRCMGFAELISGQDPYGPVIYGRRPTLYLRIA